MRNLNGIFVIIVLLASSGCATLNEAECRNADWYMIGMEDGIKGRLESFIGEHRSACAQYDIIPDMNAYRQGHREGVQQYCTELNGFEIGKRGGRYNGVCPPDIEARFLDGFHIGRKIHAVQESIDRVSATIQAKQQQIEEIDKTVAEKEQALVSDAQTEEQRAKLLKEIKKLLTRRGALEARILENDQKKANLEAKIRRLSRDFPNY